jgi:hypothetical protein
MLGGDVSDLLAFTINAGFCRFAAASERIIGIVAFLRRLGFRTSTTELVVVDRGVAVQNSLSKIYG